MSNRIDRIDGNKYYEYAKIKNLNVSDTDEKFSLDYKQDELPSEAKEKKDKASDEKGASPAKENNGVKLEISNNGRAASVSKPKRISTAGKQSEFSPSSLLATIQDAVTAVIAAVKDFFYKIWNEPEQGNAQDIAGTDVSAQADETVTDIGNGTDTAGDMLSSADTMKVAEPVESAELQKENEQRLDREIQPYLRSGDLHQVISLLTDNGRKIAARNSTLLTYYDRNGRMIEPSASDRERILYGDRNTRKL